MFNKKEIDIMKNRIARMEILQANGNTTTNYLSMNLVNDLDQVTELNDEMYEQIFEDGYVKNTKLHRRWIMAQTFRGLNFNSRVWTGRRWAHVQGWNDFVNYRYSYDYQFSMMQDELYVLCKLENKDLDSFNERSHFFTKETVVITCEDYMKKMKHHINHQPVKRCKGDPYIRVFGRDIFVRELDKKFYNPTRKAINKIKQAENYRELYKALATFNCVKYKLPYETKKSTAWKDAFKGSGAFYTLKNLIMFHDCRVMDGNNVLSLEDSIRELNDKLEEYNGEWWRMHAFMKKVIQDNHFDFAKTMKDIYKKN